VFPLKGNVPPWLINVLVVTRREPLVEQELLPPSEYTSSTPVYTRVHVAQSLVFCVVFCTLLFVILSLFWPYCLSFFDLQLLITLLVFSNFSQSIYSVHFQLLAIFRFVIKEKNINTNSSGNRESNKNCFRSTRVHSGFSGFEWVWGDRH